jgi:hypothetical protein
MFQSISFQSISDVVKKQRLVWSWAVIMGLFLVVVAHAPIFPVIVGCVLAILVTTLRSGYKSKNPLQ